jgi:hypothetical protein
MRAGISRIVAVTLLGAGLVALQAHTPTQAQTRSAAYASSIGRTAPAAPVSARLEPGPQTGYQFSADGNVLVQRPIRVPNNPASVTVDGRRAVPGRPGFYLSVTSGRLAGFEVLESPVSYIIGIAGNTRFDTPQPVNLAAGRYLGYQFDTDWQMTATRYRAITAPTSRTAERRAVIDGRPYLLMSSGGWAGWWLPIARPLAFRAQPIACGVPAKPSAGSSQVISEVSTTDPELALTLDMGGRLDPALMIAERLILDRVCVTVFPSGATALTTTGTAVMQLIAAHPELFEVGNHTMHHCDLVNGGVGSSCPANPPTTAQIQAELTQGETVIRDLTGWEPAPYWRPPFGAYNADVLSAVAGVGYTKTFMWDVDTIDWMPTADGGPTAASMQDKVVANASKGSIVLMHLGGYHTYDALPGMVLRLRQAGLTPTTISGLLD